MCRLWFFHPKPCFVHHFATNHGFVADFARKSHFLSDKNNNVPTLYTCRVYKIHRYDHFECYNISSVYYLKDSFICFVIGFILCVPQPFKYDMSRDNWNSKFSSFGQKNVLKNHISWMEGATVMIYPPNYAEFNQL